MIKGKGAQSNPGNPFLKNVISYEHDEGLDEYVQEERPETQLFYETPKSVLSKNTSPDLKYTYSLNPYQGCEHGCIYCYARNSHTYWGFSAGLDFESKIIVKENAASKLEEQLLQPGWNVQPIMLSGNTDCYQPIEKKLKLTREILKVLNKYQHPVSIITKNSLISRDIDLLQELSSNNLVHVYFSVTSMNEDMRRVLEPRTASYRKKMETIAQLSERNIPVGVMNAPIIPGLNHHEVPTVLENASNRGALAAGYTVVRLNGQVGKLFEEWLHKTFPDRAEKVSNQIKALHDGKVNDTEWGRRLNGAGAYATMIEQLFDVSVKKHFSGKKMPPLNTLSFRKGGNFQLF